MQFQYELLVIESAAGDEHAKVMWTEVFGNAADCENFVSQTLVAEEQFTSAHPEFVFTTMLLAWPPTETLSPVEIQEY